MEPRPSSPERQAIEAIDLGALRAELESRKFAWYFVEGAIDFLKNRKDYILRTFDDYKDDPKALEQMMGQIAEMHIKEFTPPGWVEPIRVPIGGVDYRLTGHIGGVLADALLAARSK